MIKGRVEFIILVVLLLLALVFLVFTFWMGPNQYINKRTYCVQGSGALVYPGPGAPPSTYCQGQMTFQRSEDFIAWHLIHNLSSTVLSIDILGPVLDTNPLYGPEVLNLCQAGTPVSCYFSGPNVLDQHVDQTLAGLPIGNYIEQFTVHADRYLVRISTADYPDGEVVMRLFSLC